MKRVSGCVSMALLLAAQAGCSVNKLTREAAATLIKPQVAGLMSLAIPKGEYSFADDDLVNGLVERGVGLKRTKVSAGGFLHTNSFAVTDAAKPFVVELSGRPVLALVECRFGEITGIREVDSGGTSTEVEFTWLWQATPVGLLLDGASLKRHCFDPAVIQIGKEPHQAKATCARFDNGWRCDLSQWRCSKEV